VRCSVGWLELVIAVVAVGSRRSFKVRSAGASGYVSFAGLRDLAMASGWCTKTVGLLRVHAREERSVGRRGALNGPEPSHYEFARGTWLHLAIAYNRAFSRLERRGEARLGEHIALACSITGNMRCGPHLQKYRRKRSFSI